MVTERRCRGAVSPMLFVLAGGLVLLGFVAIAVEAAEPSFVTLSPLSSPIPESLYSVLAVTLISAGLVATAMFFVYEVTVSRFNRSVVKEAVYGGAASVLLGFGTLFLFLWTGVYV